MLLRSALVALLVLVVALPATTNAQRCVTDTADRPAERRYCGVSLLAGMGGPQGFGETSGAGDGCLHQNDDGSSPAIPFGDFFPGGLRFFDRTHEQLFVNTNGNVSFAAAVPTYTPTAFPVATNPMIAPFWADVDIRTADGSCTEPSGGAGSGACFAAASNGVWWHFDAATGGSPARAVFTWDETSYFSCHDERRASFQLVLTAATTGCAAPGDFDVEFRFNRCEWESGDASEGVGGFGGIPAQAGFDAGNRTNYVQIAGSRMPDISRVLCEESNVGEPGIWRFQIRSGAVVCPDAGEACDVPGALGACAHGRTTCEGGGTTCVAQVEPTDERCDILDNDCDGLVDEASGARLCPGAQVCRRGACIDICFEGGCLDGFVCTDDGCVEAACVDSSCGDGQRCRGGVCAGACEGVTCPHGQECWLGRCIDPCAGITCDACAVCDEGACTARCGADADCDAGERCHATGRCVASSCAAVTCGAGTACVDGACVDACDGATCPAGETCTGGACVPAGEPPRPDAGATADAGTAPNGAADASASPDATASTSPPGRRPPTEASCSAQPARRAGAHEVAAVAAVVALAFARRRRNDRGRAP